MATENKWTAGPWHIAGDDEIIEEVPVIEISTGKNGVDYKPIAYVNSDLHGGDVFLLTDEEYATAHLIAAAPDMYEALEGLLEIYTEGHRREFTPGDRKVRADRARAALSKARGE